MKVKLFTECAARGEETELFEQKETKGTKSRGMAGWAEGRWGRDREPEF
jgi:hypothetical protein